MASTNTAAQRENAIGSGLAGVERFSSAEVQDRLFRESIDKALNELQTAAERGTKADVLKIEMLARNAKDPALQDALRKSFADLQKQIGDSLAAAQGSLDNKAALKAVLGELGKLAKAGGWAFSAYQIDQAVDSGDSRRIGRALTDLLTGALAVEAGAVMGGLVISSALGPIIGAALGAWIAANWLSGLFPEFEQWLGELTQDLRDKLSAYLEEMFGDDAQRDRMNNSFDPSGRLLPPIDPLVLDLDGDGIESVPVWRDDGVLFDHSGDGNATQSGWVGPNDGFLVVDKNGNGAIDDGSELFGDSSVLENGLEATDGFAALEEYDSNGDGVVDAADDKFNDLKIWRDENQDGISQPNELLTLGKAGVSALKTGRTAVNTDLGDGNTLLFGGSYVGVDGYEREMGDILLLQDTYRAEFRDNLAIPEEYYMLPDIAGSGQVRNLREAATLSATLKTAIESYMSKTTVADQKALLDDLLQKWAGTSTYDPKNIRFLDKIYHLSYSYAPSTEFSASQLEAMQGVVEKFVGRPLFDVYGWLDDPSGFQNVSVTQVGNDIYVNVRVPNSAIVPAYEALADGVYESLFVQTLGAPMIESLNLVYREGAFEIEFSDMEAAIDSAIEDDAIDGFSRLFELLNLKGDLLASEGWNAESFIGERLKTVALTSELVDLFRSNEYSIVDESGVVYDAPGSRVIFGSVAGDRIEDYQGTNKIIVGGPGDDVMDAGPKGYTYVFNIGDGKDTVFLGGSSDRLRFGEGISQEDIHLRIEGNNVVVQYSENDETILDTSYLLSGSGVNVTLVFDGGRSMQFLLSIPIDASGATIPTVDIFGGSKGDVISAEYPVDRLHRLVGGDGNDLIISGSNGDHLEGNDGDDTLVGGAGDDTLKGGLGSDIYVFGFGDGKDAIYEERIDRGGRLSGVEVAEGLTRYPDTEMGNNVILFASGVAPGDVTVTIDSQDLLFTLTGGLDSLRIPSWDREAIGRITFEDYPDVVWEQEDIFRMAYAITDSGGTAYGGLGDDVIVGMAGNDLIDASYGYDIIKGMGGDDQLYGSTGFSHVEGGPGNDAIRGVANSYMASVIVVDPGAGDDSVVMGGSRAMFCLIGDLGRIR